MLELLLWFSLALVFYSYAVYPLLLILLSSVVQTKVDIRFVLGKNNRRAVDIDCKELPAVGIIISAYNESKCIAARVRNLQDLDYPKSKIKYYIGCDGSTDDTPEILRSIEDPNLVATIFPENRGKASVLNVLVASADEEILVFSDANTEFRSDAVRKLARHFHGQNPVDVVCGELDLYAGITGESLDSAYWRYERILKFNESRINALLGANGAIYAVRKNAYTPLAPDTVIDDFTMVFNISLDGGLVIYDPEAVAREEVAPSSAAEYHRRVRIGAGNFQAFWRCWRGLIPTSARLWFSYVSHKVLRWHTPHCLVVALLCSLILAFDSLIYQILFLIQCLIYLLCAYFRNREIQSRFLGLVVFWVSMNIALGHGALRYYRGGMQGNWESTGR